MIRKINSEILILGMGISGGDKGALKGPSLMIGGDKEAYKIVAKDLQKASAKGVKGKPCCAYLGDRGAGHFVKIIHNGIEYAEMQLIAEIFSLLMETLEGKINSIQKELESWQKSSSESYLLGITSEILKYEENLLGTAGTLLENISLFDDKNCTGLIIHADNVTNTDISKLISFHYLL